MNFAGPVVQSGCGRAPGGGWGELNSTRAVYQSA
jgi:hypothetical protein